MANKPDNAEMAKAMLALALHQKQAPPLGAEPSDEELAILLEGGLDATRKAQILGHIAHDGQVYHRWMMLLENADATDYFSEIDQPAQHSSAQKNVASESWLQRLFDWLSQPVGLSALGGLATACLVVFIALSGKPGYQGEIDDYYANYPLTPPTWDYRPKSPFLPEWSEQAHVVAQGVQAGLDTLGPPFSIPGFAGAPETQAKNPVKSLPSQQREALLAAGKLAAWLYFACQQPGEMRDLSKLAKTARELNKPLESSEFFYKERLTANQDALCAYGRWVIAALQ